MTATTDTYFEEQWERTDDPWDQVHRFSEQRKYDLTVAALPRPRYRRSFEPGCATGSLTRRLATRVDAQGESSSGRLYSRRPCRSI